MNKSEHGWIPKVEVRSHRGTVYVPAGIALLGAGVLVAATLFAAERQPKPAISRGTGLNASRTGETTRAVRAAPPLAVPNANPGSGAKIASDEPAVLGGIAPSNVTALYITGFEPEDGWFLGTSICGPTFLTCVGNGPASNACTGDPLVDGNCCDKDPNTETGWFMNGLARHCNQPHIDNVHPFAGTQHLRMQYDPAGGNPPGCTGFGSGCRQRWNSPWDRNQPQINKTTWQYEIAFSHGFVGTSTNIRNFYGNITNGGGIFVHAYIYFDAAGYQIVVNPSTGATLSYLGNWTYDSPDYAQVTVEYDPCNNTVNYKYVGKPNIFYPGVCSVSGDNCGAGGFPDCPVGETCVGGGVAMFSEPMGFSPPYGDYCNYSGANCTGAADPRPPYLDSFTWSQSHYNDGQRIDMDNFCITHVECPDACCNGILGTCSEGLTAQQCSGLGMHYFPNVQCAQLGTPGFPPACGIDRGSCCDAGPGSGGSCTDGVLEADCQPPQKTWHRGASCDGFETLCAVGHGMCSSGFDPGKPTNHCTTDPTRECLTNADCAVDGFCYGGHCTPVAAPGHCQYSSAGFCEAMGRCSGSATCTPSTGAGCCDPTCATPVNCPSGQTCTVEKQGCDAPSGADCAFCELCDAWPTVGCQNIGQGGECPPPAPNFAAGTCTANVIYVCNGDADCPAGLSGGICVFPPVSPGGFLCTDHAQCVIPATTCGPEHTGACCDGDTGVCFDDVLEANCTGGQLVWTKLTTCAEAGCIRHTGACCDGTSGNCTNNVPESQCPTNDPQVRWEKGVSCADLNPPCTEHTGACCDGTSGICVDDVPASQCPTTVLRAGPGDPPCSACPPGPGFVSSCSAGMDNLQTAALVGIDLTLDGVVDTNLILSGPAEVIRQSPSGGQIDTEIVSMTLTGGGATLRAGSGLGLPASLGQIVQQQEDPSVADSFFDVFFEVDIGGMVVHNQTPLHVQMEIECIPPQGTYVHVITQPIPLFDQNGVHVANLVTARHITFPDQFRWEKGVSCDELNPPCMEHTGACCDGTTGICNDNVPASQCPTSAPQVRWEKGVSCADLKPPCEPPPNDIIWNPDPLSPDRTTRSLRFTVTGPGASKLDAIRVTMVDLQNPNPANAVCCPPQDFSAYEYGATCTDPGGCARWVGKPGTFYERQGPPLSEPYRAARLQCSPFYADWVGETASAPISVVGAEVMPSSEYSVKTYGSSCVGIEATCTDVGTAVTMKTRRSGDVETGYNPPGTGTQPDASDVTALVNKFKNLAGAPVKARSQLQPNLPELNTDVSATDIVAVVDAYKGFAYPYGGPCPCPSLVICGVTACPGGAGTCTGSELPGLGAEATCVKTCTGGTNADDPCIDPAHCPGGTCGSPFCRDKCGRCTP
jgi:hypothetical protein